ncbi:OLC1v1029331C1 [Oldenlandia corymbosa var. corymbosa]|uniref:Nuclear transcription factor Y subunit n=1 Tax=Oldenlandia corymbosa var. corymbosa TaxID=529605 RepID=A0AAV1CEB5_OLDCO|nr:OLC1v1029331C1 [Oldenlandia corymbosa var. corymbosa]
MQTSSNKGGQSLTPLFITCSSLWNSTEEPKYSPSKSTITAQESSLDDLHPPKQSDSPNQEQDASSTLTSSHSHYGTGDAARNSPSVQNIGTQHGSDETCERHGDPYHRSHFLYGNTEYGFGQVPQDYKKATACITFPCSESYFGGLVSAYGQNAFIYPPMVGLTPARVPLPPLECAENIPMFVNAKQFRAILRRRQIRAKLEAHNRIVKSRRPYLHESRHVHALKRPRGAGGRFLNTKNIKQPQLSAPSHHKDISEKKFGKVSAAETRYSDCGSWGISTPSASDVTGIFNGGDIFQQQGVRVPVSSYRMGIPVREDFPHLEAGNRLFSFIDGRAQD